MKRRIGLLLICLSLICAAALTINAQQKTDAPSAPVFIKLKGVDGKMYDIAEMRGQVLLVSFGATWCAPCYEELRALVELKQEYKGKPVNFMWVSMDTKQQTSDAYLRSFAKSLKINFPVLRDPTGLTYAQFSAQRRMPLVIFFDPQGNVASPNHFGMSDVETYKTKMRGIIDKLLSAEANAKVE